MRSLRLVLFLLFLGLTLLFGFWGAAKPGRRLQERPFRLVESAAPQTVIGRWIIQIETPRELRVGDAELIRLLVLPADDSPGTPQPAFPGPPGDISFPGALAATTMVAEARLDLAGLEIRPDQTISEPLLPGKAVLFFWSVRAAQPGEYSGVAWLHLRLISTEGERVIPLSAQEVRLQVRTLWGLSANAARGLSLLWAILTFFLGFPYLKDIVLWIKARAQTQERGGSSGQG